MALTDKYKAKIRKLLALAESDNPHEAERARVQAEKMMKKHNLMAGDVEVVSLEGKAYNRRQPKQSETLLIAAIARISACEVYAKSLTRVIGNRYAYKSRPVFMGLQPDAEMAVYCWDVLYSQMLAKQREMKRQYQLNANDLEIYSTSWALEASEKLVNVFGVREVPEKVSSARSREDFKSTTKSRAPKVGEDSERDSALYSLGSSHGREARLNAATTDQTDKQARLSFVV